jgi:catechol 2,3-dioxygenase-like lactoylglutathione lyase family enzyme
MMAEFRHIGFYVDDVDKGIGFYRALGFREVYRAREEWAAFNPQGEIDVLKLENERGDIVEFIGNSVFAPDNAGVHAAFTVSNMEQTRRALAALGTVFFVEPRTSGDGKVIVAFCTDPFGFKIELVQEL